MEKLDKSEFEALKEIKDELKSKDIMYMQKLKFAYKCLRTFKNKIKGEKEDARENK